MANIYLLLRGCWSLSLPPFSAKNRFIAGVRHTPLVMLSSLVESNRTFWAKNTLTQGVLWRNGRVISLRLFWPRRDERQHKENIMLRKDSSSMLHITTNENGDEKSQNCGDVWLQDAFLDSCTCVDTAASRLSTDIWPLDTFLGQCGCTGVDENHEADSAEPDLSQPHEHGAGDQQECEAATESTADACQCADSTETDQSQPHEHGAGDQQECEAATESMASASPQEDQTTPTDDVPEFYPPALIGACPAQVVDTPTTNAVTQEGHITCHLHPHQEDEQDDEADVENAPPSVDGAFPLAVMDMLEAFAAARHASLCTIVAPFLGMVGGLIGSKRLIKVYDLTQPGNLWICVIAPSSIGKSFSALTVMKYVSEAEQFYNGLKPKKMLGMMEFTPVSLVRNLSTNPQGLIVYPDELSPLLRSFKKDPSFKEQFMTTYEGGAMSLERARQSQCAKASYALTTIISTTTFRRLMENLDWRDIENGFLSRLSIIHGEDADGLPLLGNAVIDQHHYDLLHKITMNLARMGMNGLDDTRKVVTMTPDAVAEYKRVFDGYSAKAKVHKAERPLFARLRTRVLRLVLGLHCLKAATKGEDGLAPVPVETVKAAEILGNWLEWHERRTWKLVKERPTMGTPSTFEDGQNDTEVEVMRALVDDAQFIEANGGKIPTTRVLEKVKFHQPNATQEGVGRTLKKLLGRRGIRNAGPNQARGFVVLPEELAAFRTALNM